MPLKALVIGLGAIGQRHARNLRLLLGEELELAALRSRRAPTVITDQLTAENGDPEADCNGGVFTDLDEALATGPDVVLVCTPSRLHIGPAIAAVRAGAAVFVEKPLSADMTGVDQLVAEARAHDAVVAVGCQLRFHPALRELRVMLRDGAVGTLLAVHVEQAEYLPSFHPYEDYRQSYASRRSLGGGVALTQIHELDYLQWLFGLPRRLFAVGGTLGDLEIDVEDTVSALLECRLDHAPLPVHVHLDYLQRPPRRTCRVVGTEGTISLDLREPLLVRTDNSGNVLEENRFPGHVRARMFTDELRAFLEAARRERPPEVGLDHAVGTLRIAEAMLASMRDGTVQEL